MRMRGEGAGDRTSAPEVGRRHILAAACALGSTALAGCHEDDQLLNLGGHERDESGALQTGGTEQPAWSKWVDADAEYFAVTDFSRIAEVDAYMSVLDTVGHSRGLINPKALYPFSGVESVAESVPTLAGYSPMVFPGMDSELFVMFEDISIVTENVDDSPIAVEQYIHVDDVVVLAGEMDRAGIAGRSSVEERDRYEDFTMYRVRGAYGEHWPVAATDRHLLFGLGETFEDDRQLVESAIDTATAGVGVGEGRQWLRERCHTGAFVVGAGWGEKLFLGEGQDKGFLVDVGVDTETMLDVLEFFTTADVDHSLFVADGHEDGRVTRTGLALADGADQPEEGSLLDHLAPEAEQTNLVGEENRFALEAFWQ